MSKKKKIDWQDATYRQLKSEQAKAIWQDEELAKRIIRNAQAGPNKPEQRIMELLESLFPNEWKFVGDGQVFINGKCPDFININGQKKIIELFGDYWHRGQGTRKRKECYKSYGYDTLIIWEKELKDVAGITQRITEFNSKNK